MPIDSRIWHPDSTCIPFVMEQGLTGAIPHVLFSWYLDATWKAVICGITSIGSTTGSPGIEFVRFGLFQSKQIIDGGTWNPAVDANLFEIPIVGGGLKNVKIHENAATDKNVKGFLVGRGTIYRGGPFFRIILEGGLHYAVTIIVSGSPLGQLSLWGYSFPLVPNDAK